MSNYATFDADITLSGVLDAEATAEIFASLVEADLSFACALRTVNEALLLREDAESVCALDTVCFDLYTGNAVFRKAGAAASYVLHKGKVDCVETPCMPVGILPDATFRETERTLRTGDAFVLVSDGACGMHDEHILQALTAFQGGSAQKLAEDILARSCARNRNRADDSTVLAVVVESV
jgi:stage II sporulation protein E